MQKKKKKKKERKIPAWWWAIEQLIVSWEIKTPVKERSRNSLLVISFLLRRRLAWSFFSKKKKKLVKRKWRCEEAQRTLIHLSLSRQKEKISAPANYNQGDERDEGRQKRKKIPPYSHLRKGGEVNSPPRNSILRSETGEVDLMDVEVISGRSSSLSSHHRIKN